jgi:uncharacterized protein (DUF427 family)
MNSSPQRERVRVERGQKRVRILFAGEYIADSTRVALVWERPFYPAYYFPADDVRTDLLVATGESTDSPSQGDADVYTVAVGDRAAQGAARWHRTSAVDELAGHIRFDWKAMDAWFEEDEQVYVHARNPYTRIDVLQSSRHVRVEVDGVTLADSHMPRILFETGLPPRYYLPKTAVRMDLLRRSETHTECPYKGTASYYHVRVGGRTHDDLVWWYPHPIPESAPIAGYLSFYDERVDVYVDDVLQDHPNTPFT